MRATNDRLGEGALRSILDREPLAVGVLEPLGSDGDLCIVYRNESFQALKPFRPMLMHPFFEVWPELAGIARPRMREVLATGEPWVERDLELDVEVAPGQVSHRHYSYEVSRLATGAERFLLATIDDVTKEEDARQGLRSALHTSELLLEAASALSESIDTAQVLQSLVEVLVAATDRKRAIVSVYEPEREEIVVMAAVGRPTPQLHSRYRLRDLAPENRETLEGRHALVVDYTAPHLTEESRQRAAQLEFKRALLVPLVWGEEAMGYFALDDPGADSEFREDEVGIAEAIAAQAAVAIENARLFAAQREAARYSGALNQVDLLSSTVRDFNDLIQKVLHVVVSATGADLGAVYLPSGNLWSVHSVSGSAPEWLLGATVPQERIPYSMLASQRRRVMSFESPDTIDGWEGSIAQALDAVDVLDGPLPTMGEGVGNLTLYSRTQTKHFSDADEDFLAKAVTSLSLAVQNSRLVSELTEQADYAEALNTINSAVHSTLDFDEIMDRVVVEVTKALGVHASAVHMHRTGRWEFTYSYRLPEGLRRTSLPDEQAPFSMRVLQTREPLVSNDVLHDERANVRLMERFGITALIGVPLVVRGQALGVLFSGCLGGTRAFTDRQVDFTQKAAATLALALENARLYETERGIADRLQAALLSLPTSIAAIDFAHDYRSATDESRVGGDFYDLFEIEHDLLGVTVGDVAGKGLDAAVLTSLAKNAIRAHASEKKATPAKILEVTNDLIHEATPTESFVTVFFGVLDCRDGTMVYANAGHTAAGLVHVGGDTERLPATGPILGAFRRVTVRESTVCLDLGELLFLYTDGLTEARSQGEFFGEDRVFALLDRLPDRDPQAAVQRMLEEVLRYADGRLDDDLALLALRRRGAETEATNRP